MTRIHQIKKISDEGTSSPFIARIFFGLLSFRDQLYLNCFEGDERYKNQNYFDKQFNPMYEAARATRDAAIKINSLMSSHFEKIQSGKAIKFRENQYEILETIDSDLSQLVDQFIDQSIVATKSGLQNILRDPLGLDIGFFFKQDKAFLDGVSKLIALGEEDLANYLEEVRQEWHSDLQDLRSKHEHKGWTLGSIKYHLDERKGMLLVLPDLCGLPVDSFVLRTTNQILQFIENMMVYALQRFSSMLPIYIVEVPKNNQNPENPIRFRLAPKGLDTSLPWRIHYSEDMDFV